MFYATLRKYELCHGQEVRVILGFDQTRRPRSVRNQLDGPRITQQALGMFQLDRSRITEHRSGCSLPLQKRSPRPDFFDSPSPPDRNNRCRLSLDALEEQGSQKYEYRRICPRYS
ncbi:hypothetical protein PCASD_16340 [Puccinia coronata f. sp. avenae]|uniref:Uncharacterized protein n=1 Tax=Puccinia coronata f. sp. avenae TaxID=200324 RepID=A0A2N5UH74_9BASI|nr:hypothetical protein PCASD_16340 [Puccinia coronata f. sp. avenae]